jgi:hypothetical protein
MRRRIEQTRRDLTTTTGVAATNIGELVMRAPCEPTIHLHRLPTSLKKSAILSFCCVQI